MAVPKIQPATIQHAEYIASRVRRADREELWASHMMTPLRAMHIGIKSSEFCVTGLDDEEPVVMWGVNRPCLLSHRHGVPWMVATEKLDQKDVMVAFLRRCREPLLVFMKEFDILENYVDERNTRAIRWLQYMGFDVSETSEPYGLLGLPFRRFEMRSLPCVGQSL